MDVKAVLSGVSFGGLVLGWALKQVLSEAISGALIVTTQPFKVGQRVCIRTQMMNFEGTVARLTLNHTVLVKGEGPGDAKQAEVGKLIHSDDKTGGNVDTGSTILIPNSLALKAVIRIRS